MKLIRGRTPLAPVLKEPRAPATQESQLLFGHIAEVVATERAWLRVRGADAYEGWIHKGYVESVDESVSADRTIPWGWETLGDLSLGCVMRDEHGATVDLPWEDSRSGKCIGAALLTGQERDSFD